MHDGLGQACNNSHHTGKSIHPLKLGDPGGLYTYKRWPKGTYSPLSPNITAWIRQNHPYGVALGHNLRSVEEYKR